MRRIDPRTDLLIAALAAISVFVYVLSAHMAGGVGFPLDDSWIHQTYARNLAQTGQWAFVPGIPSAGSTSPLYTILLSVGFALRVDNLLWAMLLGGAALAAAGMIGARVAVRLFPDVPGAGFWSGLAIVGAWHLIWSAAAGMETILFAALCLGLIYLALREIGGKARFANGLVFGLCGAAVIATRPEGILLVGLSGLAMLVARPQADWRGFGLWAVGAALGGLVGIAPYALLSLSLNGTLLPDTASAKQAQAAPLLLMGLGYNLWEMLKPMLAGGQFLLIPGAGVAVLYFARRARQAGDLRGLALALLPLAWAVAHYLLYVLRLPMPAHHGRYLIPILPAFIVTGVGGTLALVAWLRRWRPSSARWRVIRRTFALLVPLLFAVWWWLGAQYYSRDVQMINSDMLVAARWLNENVPPERLLAVHDIGAVGFFASSVERPRPILDIAGLVSPEMIPYYRNPPEKLRILIERKVQFLMVLPTQWDEMWLGDGAYWGRQFCLRFNANGGMGGMSIYEFKADGNCP